MSVKSSSFSTWDFPLVQKYAEAYWAKHKIYHNVDFFDWVADPCDTDKVFKYLFETGYLTTAPLLEKERLNNEIHSIFKPSQWRLLFSKRTGPDDSEPYVTPNDSFREVGISWENYVFGCSLDLHEYDVQPLRCAPWDCMFPRDSRLAIPPWSPIPMVWVREWFVKDTWDENSTIATEEHNNREFLFALSAQISVLLFEKLYRETGVFQTYRFQPSPLGSCWSWVLYEKGTQPAFQNRVGMEPGDKQEWPQNAGDW
ncbi:hypothetical protein BCR34DRAFT_596268 [Clohesyomyces aquaticus]|uniref:Uncharacterized protein n=1 Tax=Clohesyomyces aquaticus TaxID=1231657 RepID=A0A1Y2A7N8_9PLEO|nr:hypothetical protein BCR34DRAFT_596268 [Clohesyomyces aquaticus]